MLSAGGPEDGKAKPEKIGKTLLLNVGLKGKHVGVVGFYPDAKNASERIKFELVSLDAERFADDLPVGVVGLFKVFKYGSSGNLMGKFGW